ncbi:MAG: glycosyltransferase family 2 protein [Bacteroidaceae bacterium]|nr:glycosyltransferase family 2 protein [Bacteroidaceae bacterium]MBR5890531.1 glycosyltransferase family 2 protein [Bacteroidaceae bacterium]
MLDISAIILTFNEEIHIKRCLDNISPDVKEVFVIDSYSTDKTLEIAKEYANVTILQNKFVNYATQFNWALKNAPITSKWVLRLDADEYLTRELKNELEYRIPLLDNNITGIIFNFKRVWMGQTLRYGMTKLKLLRLFQYGKAESEARLMDEHIRLLEGEAIEFEHEFADDNLNHLSWWTNKHVGYAIREAIDLLDMEYNLTGAANADSKININKQAKSKRMLKHRYAKQPLFLRAFAYFCYRYFFRFGFLDGKKGFLWHFLQGWWYRTLVDAKVFEIKNACGKNPEKIKQHLKDVYHIEL